MYVNISLGARKNMQQGFYFLNPRFPKFMQLYGFYGDRISRQRGPQKNVVERFSKLFHLLMVMRQ